MADKDIKQKTLDMLVVMNTVIKNMRLYPPTSSSVVNAVEKLHQAFTEILAAEESVTFAESEKCLLVCGDPLSQKDHEKAQVNSLLEILLNLGIRSVTFNKGLEKGELGSFLELLGKKPESIKNEGGIQQIVAAKNFLHIYLDQKVYVARNDNQQLLSSLNITDDQLVGFLMNVNPDLAPDPQKIQEMSSNPEWLVQNFQKGLSQITGKKGTRSNLDLSENVANMIVLMDKATGDFTQNDRAVITKGIGQAIANMDAEISLQITAHNLGQLFGGTLLPEVISSIRTNKTDAPQLEVGGVEDKESASGKIPDLEKILHQVQLMQLKERLKLLLKDDDQAFLDIPLILVLPKIFEQLVQQNEQDVIELMINRLIGKLASENTVIRTQASKALAEIMEQLPPVQKDELLEKINARLLDWIKMETAVTPAYRKISNHLKGLSLNFISQQRYKEAIPLLDVFNDIKSGALKKDEEIRAVAEEIMTNLTTEEHLAVLFNEFNSNEQNKQSEAGQVLLRIGDVAVNRLLDILRDNADSDERVRIMKIIIGIGQQAIPVVAERINKNAPWYYLRNLAYMMGQIGNEASASALQPLLRHENSRVRLEALKSLQRTGGNERGRILLPILPEADDSFKLSIIETLGNAKYAGAVSSFLDMLKNRPLVASAMRADLEEKICIALGAIGSAEALPALTEIAEAKSFLRVRSYSDKVKSAASRALAAIRKKQTEATAKH